MTDLTFDSVLPIFENTNVNLVIVTGNVPITRGDILYLNTESAGTYEGCVFPITGSMTSVDQRNVIGIAQNDAPANSSCSVLVRGTLRVTPTVFSAFKVGAWVTPVFTDDNAQTVSDNGGSDLRLARLHRYFNLSDTENNFYFLDVETGVI